MKMGPVSADDSMASVLRIRNDTSSKKTQWNPVECDTLQATIQNFVPDSSNPKTKVFVKVDIEGFEAELVRHSLYFFALLWIVCVMLFFLTLSLSLFHSSLKLF